MRKIFGYLVVYTLFLLSAFLVAIPLCGVLLFMWANRLICWTDNKHKYNSKAVLSGYSIDALQCSRCNKPISDEDKVIVLKEIESFIAVMQQTQAILNEVLKTPEEEAVENIINETKSQ